MRCIGRIIQLYELLLAAVNTDVGLAVEEGIHEPVPLWRFLCIREAEGTRMSQHRMDRRMRCPKTPCQN
jgi:hypothetical protein